MLDTIRQLSRTVKLKDVIIGSFIPEDSAKGVERRAVWSQEEDCWTVQKLVGDYTILSPLPLINDSRIHFLHSASLESNRIVITILFSAICRITPQFLFFSTSRPHLIVSSCNLPFKFNRILQDFSGNKIRAVRPTSSSKLRRPESEYARQR